ncbi:hypothetical protein Salat_1438400 [Sesamum alatum]|uniref:Uncharacterized protein n=1 Tax=Sesamum alatum TaxID=300844 RepID=A0AAE1YAU1_9LAMI|nr:hypothetical protein Salat_1438400 [Sesamum alatum]
MVSSEVPNSYDYNIKKPFHFDANWTIVEECNMIVRDIWAQSSGGEVRLSLGDKFAKCRVLMEDWQSNNGAAKIRKRIQWIEKKLCRLWKGQIDVAKQTERKDVEA